MSHDPIIEYTVEKDKRDHIILMADRVENLMELFPILVKEQSLTYNLAGNIPIDEEKMSEIVKLKILSVLLELSYDDLKVYLGYVEEV